MELGVDVKMNQIIPPFPRQSKLEVCANNCKAKKLPAVLSRRARGQC